jgi:hypothetical protein
VSIQDYTGEGYTLYDANEEYGKIAEENRETVVAAVEQYFIDNYSAEVEVHNFVSAVDGVTVFVESIDEPHFYTIAIVPIDLQNEEIKTDSVWSREGEVELAIQGGLYAKAFEEEFANLDKYLKGITEEHKVIGTPKDVIRNVQGSGYSTPYYFISPMGEIFKKLYEEYEVNPEITKQELEIFFNENPVEPSHVNFAIELYTEESDINPNEKVLDKIIADIKEIDNIPKGAYSVFLNDNYIDKTRGDGMKENTLERTFPDEIIKD